MKFLYKLQNRWETVEAFDKSPQNFPDAHHNWDVTDLEVRINNSTIQFCMKEDFFKVAIPITEGIINRLIVK